MVRIDLDMPQGITAFSTLRDATTPDDPYSGFNTCHYVADRPAHVAASRRVLHTAVGATAYIFPRQTHSCNVAVIDRTTDTVCQPDDTDALVTSLPDVALCIHTADCVPLVLADTAAGVIAAAHSGWKGTVASIATATVEAMTRLGAEPSRIVAAMGPCICADCFEVGEEVAERFLTAGMGAAVKRTYSAKPHIDLPRAVADTLIACGVRRFHIALPPACSRCNPHDFFSARAAGISSGRTLTLIMRQ